MVVGIQDGFTKYACFLYEWGSRDSKNHWKRKQWPPRKTIAPGTNNSTPRTACRSKNVLLPPFHIKLGFMKQFVKAIDRESACLQYSARNSPLLKLKFKRDYLLDIESTI
ncbi:UNVERIFIED_CONTAM: hypothetical protein RMT77_019592 [Armadillidium vulgare]